MPPGFASIYAYESVEPTDDNPFGSGRSAGARIGVPATGDVPAVALKLRLEVKRFGDDSWVKRSTKGTKVEHQVKDEAVIGSVVDGDGKPVPGAKLLRDGTPMVAANEKGEFRVAIAKGTQLILHAWAPGHHVWLGTPTTREVDKIVLERKEKPPAAGR